MKSRLLILSLLILLVIPIAYADDDDHWYDFDWADIGGEIAESFYDFMLDIVNAPLQPLLYAVKELMQEKTAIDVFRSIWAIVCYTISIFYSLLFMYSGFNFITSGHDPSKREKAKRWLKNIIVMIMLINASFFLYGLVLEFNALLTEGVLGLVHSGFFRLTGESIGGIGMELLMSGLYLITLVLTLLILAIRYVIVAFGVVFFPIGIFLYFIEPLRSYGKLIFNFLGVSIFLTFFDGIILLVCSQLVDVGFFSSFKIWLMVAAFTICNVLMLYLMFFAAIKSAFKTGGKIAVTAGKVAKYFA